MANTGSCVDPQDKIGHPVISAVGTLWLKILIEVKFVYRSERETGLQKTKVFTYTVMRKRWEGL